MILLWSVRYIYIIMYLEGFLLGGKNKKEWKRLLLLFCCFFVVTSLLTVKSLEPFVLSISIALHFANILLYMIVFKVDAMKAVAYFTLLMITNIQATFVVFGLGLIGKKVIIVSESFAMNSSRVIYIFIGMFFVFLLTKTLSIREKIMEGMIEKQLFAFVGFNLYVFQLFLRMLFRDFEVSNMRSFIISMSLSILATGYLIMFELFCMNRRVTRLIEEHGLHRPIIKDLQKIVTEKNKSLEDYLSTINHLKDIDEVDQVIGKIKEDCFINVSFSDDDILNAILFNYYIILEDLKVVFITKVPSSIDELNINLPKLYDVCIRIMEFLVIYIGKNPKVNQLKLFIDSFQQTFYIQILLDSDALDMIEIEKEIEDVHFKLRKYDHVKNIQVNLSEKSLVLSMEIK